MDGSSPRLVASPVSSPALIDERRPLLPNHETSNGIAYGTATVPSRTASPLGADARHRTTTQQSNSGFSATPVAPDQNRSGRSTPVFMPTPLRKVSYLFPNNFTSKSKQYWSYYVPVFSWLPSYSLKLFAGDFAAGLTLSCLLIPQSMSYASGLAKLDPVNGLFGVIIPAFLYSIFGTCNQLNVGPEAALSLLVGQTTEKLLGPHNHHSAAKIADLRAGIASAIVFEVGLITFLLGALRLGFMDAVLSRALLRGFITAVGFIIFIEQSIPLLGLEAQAQLHHIGQETPIDKLLFVIQHVSRIHKLTACISMVCLTLLVSAKIVKPKISRKHMWINYVPEILIVVVVATVLANKLGWAEKGVDVLGRVSAGAVHLHFPIHSGKVARYALSSEVTSAAITIAIMGYVDSIVAGKQNASRYNYAISPNRELTALGIANLGASLVSGTIPGYGSITRSRLAANAGARTPMSGFFVALFTLLSTFFLLQYLFYLPKAVLGCIITLVVYSILAEAPEDVHFFVTMRAWTDLALMALTFLLTLFVSLQTGILVSLAVSLVIIVRKSATSMGVQIMGRVPGTENWAPIEEHAGGEDVDELLLQHGSPHEEVPGLLIIRLRESLHFANAGALKERLRRLELYGNKKHHPSDAPMRAEAQVIVFHMQDLRDVDASAIQILKETCEGYKARGVSILFAHLEGEMRKRLERGGVVDVVGTDNVKPSVKECLAAASASQVANIGIDGV